jgi:hypothetical protein
MAEIGFHGANQEIGISLRREDFSDSRYFDGVADWCSGAMTLEISSVAWRELGTFIRMSDEAFLSFYAGMRDTGCLSVAAGASETHFQ